LEIFTRDAWTCQDCGDTTTMLVVHHKRYIPGRKPWEYDEELLVTYCTHCHELRHAADQWLSDGQEPPDDTTDDANAPTVFLCDACSCPVDDSQGFGRTGRRLFCESCALKMEAKLV